MVIAYVAVDSTQTTVSGPTSQKPTTIKTGSLTSRKARTTTIASNSGKCKDNTASYNQCVQQMYKTSVKDRAFDFSRFHPKLAVVLPVFDHEHDLTALVKLLAFAMSCSINADHLAFGGSLRVTSDSFTSTLLDKSSQDFKTKEKKYSDMVS